MMGEGKEEKKRDTLLYYIGEIYRGEGKGEVFAGGKGMFRGRISRKELGLGER